ncbi:conserved Plasmodium protein, unknown function [Plasmodium malariae]|uniref:Uncharacterized protein n=1 Tax=Plasmodium malariae TaxID=5858 RepID=A0A1C3KDX4_PLAMA|nr:conserved Plasmodium protein, unknown function [Plasmodium malariae]
MMNDSEILDLERIQNKILNKKEEYDYSFIVNIVLLIIQVFLYIKLISIYYTYSNDEFINCFNQTLSYTLQNKYVSFSDIEIIQNNLSKINSMCNYEKINYSRFQRKSPLKYSLQFYNKNANTYIDYIISFNHLFNSAIFKEQTSISVTHYYYWTEWLLYILFNLFTFTVIYRDWEKKKTKKNIFQISIVALINLNILYQQFIDSIEYNSFHEKTLELLIYLYYLFLILNVLKASSKLCTLFIIPIKIIKQTIQYNCVLLAFLLSFLLFIIINYFSNDENFNNYFNSVYTFSDSSKYKNEFIYNFLFVLIFNFFFIPMIIIVSTATIFLVIYSYSDLFNFKPLNNPLWAKPKKYFFLLREDKKIASIELGEEKNDKKEGNYGDVGNNENEENYENVDNYDNLEHYEDVEKSIRIDILKISNMFIFSLFLIVFVLKIFFDRNSFTYINANYAKLLKEPFITETNEEKSFDNFTHSSEYLEYLNSIVINNIMRNKKNLKNKKLFELESDFRENNIFVYENFFHIFPYDLYVKLSEGGKVLEEVTVDNPLLSDEPDTKKGELNQYKDLFDDKNGLVKYCNAYSVLYNFEHNLFVLINVSYSIQNNEQFRKKKEIFVQEINEFNNTNYRSKLIILILLLIITLSYSFSIMHLLYYVRNKFLLCFYVCFFIICILFFIFNFMTLQSVSNSNDYVDHIKNRNISDTFSVNKLDKFKSLINNLLRIKVCKFYGNLFSYIILVVVILKIYIFFFINYFTVFVKYKYYFFFITASIFFFVLLMSLLSSGAFFCFSKNFLTWVMLYYHIQTSETFSAYEVFNKFLFFFFLFYITSIYLYIFLKESEQNVKIKLNKNNEYILPFDDMIINDQDIFLYYKAVLYSLDKTFEKVRILKEKYEICQIINQQVQWYNHYCYQQFMQNNFLHSQPNLVNFYDYSMNGAHGISDQLYNNQLPNRSVKNFEIRSQRMNDIKMDDQMISNNVTNGEREDRKECTDKYIPENKKDMVITADKMEHTGIAENSLGNNLQDYNELTIALAVENMKLFFTKLLKAKYDFNFLHEKSAYSEYNVQNGNNGKMRLINLIKRGMYDKNYVQKKERKKKKKRSQLKQMLNDLNIDLGYIENIKLSFTYILFLKIKRHILIHNINQLNSTKKDLKTEYQNKILYKSHLFNLQKKQSDDINEMEKSILLRNKLKSTVIHVIKDETFHKKQEDQKEKQDNHSEEEMKSEGGVFGKPI